MIKMNFTILQKYFLCPTMWPTALQDKHELSLKRHKKTAFKQYYKFLTKSGL